MAGRARISQENSCFDAARRPWRSNRRGEPRRASEVPNDTVNVAAQPDPPALTSTCGGQTCRARAVGPAKVALPRQGPSRGWVLPVVTVVHDTARTG